MVGGWRDDPHAAGLLARAIALAAARAHLAAGHDVVVPQFLARLTFIEQLDCLARAVGAVFHEVVLLDSKENMLRRFANRAAAASPCVEAPELVGSEDLSVMYDRFMSMIAARPGARLVRVEEGEIEPTYRAMLRNLG